MICYFDRYEMNYLLIALDSRISLYEETSIDSRALSILEDYRELRAKVAKYLKESET